MNLFPSLADVEHDAFCIAYDARWRIPCHDYGYSERNQDSQCDQLMLSFYYHHIHLFSYPFFCLGESLLRCVWLVGMNMELLNKTSITPIDMEHEKMREAMSRWYGMWGNQLNITSVASQKGSCVGTGSSDSSSQEIERKEEVAEKACCEALPEVQPCLQKHNVSFQEERHGD